MGNGGTIAYGGVRASAGAIGTLVPVLGGAAAIAYGGDAGMGSGGRVSSGFGGHIVGGYGFGFGGFGIGGFGIGGTSIIGTGVGGAAGSGTLVSGTGGATTGGSTTVTSGAAPTSLPTPTETCPTIKSGSVTFLGEPVTIWAGTPTDTQHGPVVIYWFATMSSPQEALQGLGQAAINEIVAEGGLVAAPGASNKKGSNTGDMVWYTGDFETTDEVIACAIQQMHIDTRRIYASGFSAGGLQTTVMSYARSNYMASVAPYSGGTSGFGNGTAQDSSNVPAAMVIHGAPGSDTFIMDFAAASATYESDVKSRGGFAIDCNHGGGHQIPSGIQPSIWQFMKDHPYKVKPDPYAGGLPTGFPSYCTIKQ
jgi:poly(3-hydroxybutyrate) depolymerase